MSNFVSKSSLLVRHLSLHYRHPCLSISIRLISTKETSNQQSSTVSHLIKTYTLSPKSALSISSKYQLDSPHRVEQVVRFLRTHGFSPAHISNIINKCPRLVFFDFEKTLLPKLNFFFCKGFTSHDLASILSKLPPILFRSLDNHLIPTFNYLTDLSGSQDRAIEFIKLKPALIYHDLPTFLAPQVDILLEYGVIKSKILVSMVSWSYNSKIDKEVFKRVVEEVKDMGFDIKKSQFIEAVSLKAGMSKSLWESKVNEYKKWGWSEEDFLEAFRKFPRIVAYSTDKIAAVMNFIVNEMGYESSYIVKHPLILSFSMRKRIIPRAGVFQYMLTKSLVKCSFEVFLKYSDKGVLKLMSSCDEGPQLLKLFKEKLDLSKVTK